MSTDEGNESKSDFMRGFEATANGEFTPEMQMQMSQWMEACPVKSTLALGAGFALGGVMGLFMSSMALDTTNMDQLSKMSTRDQIKHTFKDMGARSYSSAKNFAIVGGIFAGSECVIETFRAKNDMVNGISAGCFTGAVLAAKAGPAAMATGCAGFAAFSAAIDYWMRHG